MNPSAFPIEITERYKIKEIIGAGGMGQILRAFDPNLNIDVAIKILHNLDSEITAIRLQREAIAGGKLQHLNITRIFDFGLTSSNVPYIVMEFLEGETLLEILTRKGFLSVKESMEIFLQICRGLEHAHKHGIVHRDLKPSNIIIVSGDSGKQVVKILDFGLAQLENVEQKLTALNTTVGSPNYMSPEQVCAFEIDSRSDIYSLGCLVFEMLTGVLPLKGQSPIETMTMQRDLAPPLISEIKKDSEFPSSLVSLIDRCLAKLPEDRPQSAKILTEEIESIQEEIFRAGFSKSKSEPEKIDDFQTGISSRKFVIAIASVIAICFIVTFVYYQNFEFQNRKEVVRSRLLDQSDKTPATLKTLAPVVETSRNLAKDQVFTLTTSASNETTCVFSASAVDDDLRKIGQKSVQRIVLKNCPLIKGTGLKYLSDLPAKELDLNGTNIDDLALEQITKIKSLEILSLGSDNLTNKSVALLAQLPNLRFIELRSKQINDDCAPDLSKIRLLQGVSLCHTSCSPDIGVKLAKLPLVKSISLEGNSGISGESIRSFAEAKIQQLNLSDISITKEQWHVMKNLKELFRLDVTNSQSSPVQIKELVALQKLKYLDLNASPVIDDKLIDSLLNLKLQYLDLSDTKITDRQLVKLAKLGTLVNLRLKNCPAITSEGTSEFHKFFKLVWHRDCILEISTSGKNFVPEEEVK
ncbi:protein kinase [bacterium]|nr:protein kinase [bacterium]